MQEDLEKSRRNWDFDRGADADPLAKDIKSLPFYPWSQHEVDNNLAISVRQWKSWCCKPVQYWDHHVIKSVFALYIKSYLCKTTLRIPSIIGNMSLKAVSTQESWNWLEQSQKIMLWWNCMKLLEPPVTLWSLNKFRFSLWSLCHAFVQLCWFCSPQVSWKKPKKLWIFRGRQRQRRWSCNSRRRGLFNVA